MNRDDIIRMAKKAGLEVYSILEKQQVDWDCLIDDLQEFAALVAAAEREACAEVCERLPETFKIAADEFDYQAEMPTAENYAAAIRTRSDE